MTAATATLTRVADVLFGDGDTVCRRVNVLPLSSQSIFGAGETEKACLPANETLTYYRIVNITHFRARTRAGISSCCRGVAGHKTHPAEPFFTFKSRLRAASMKPMAPRRNY